MNDDPNDYSVDYALEQPKETIRQRGLVGNGGSKQAQISVLHYIIDNFEAQWNRFDIVFSKLFYIFRAEDFSFLVFKSVQT